MQHHSERREPSSIEPWPRAAKTFWVGYLLILALAILLLSGCAISPQYLQETGQEIVEKAREQVDLNNRRHAWGLCEANTLGGWQRLPDSWKEPLREFCAAYYSTWDDPPRDS